MHKLVPLTALGAMLFLLPAIEIPARAADSADINANTALTFDNAEAWNFIVKDTFDIPNISSQPSFTRDYRELLYVSAQPLSEGGVLENYQVSLIVMSLDSMQVVKTIKLTERGDYGYLGKCIACSPDGKKVVYGPVGNPTNLFFIDLENSRVIGVSCDPNINRYSDVHMYWPTPTRLDVLANYNNPSYQINLDTLDVKILPESTAKAESDVFNIQSQKNSVFDILAAWNAPLNLNVSSRKYPYKRVLLHNIFPNDGGAVPVIWSPDLRFVVIQKSRECYDGKMPASLVRFGLRPTPMLDFEIRGLDQTLTPEQRQTVKSAFTAGKRIWLSVYDARINPLTDKLVGPEENNLRGQGFLTQIEPTFKFQYTYENLPAQTNNIVSSLQVDNDENWGTKVWGQLVNVGEGDKSDLGSVNAQQQPEPPAQQAQTGIVSNEAPTVISPVGANPTLLYPAVTGGRWGFVNKSGETVINPQFERAQPFSEGLAGVRTGGRWGFIGENGKFSINPQFDAVKNFVEGMAPVQLGRRWGFINPAGKFVINPQFDEAACFTNGLARVKLGAQFGYINASGVFVNNPTN
jgi:hypothetical protein